MADEFQTVAMQDFALGPAWVPVYPLIDRDLTAIKRRAAIGELVMAQRRVAEGVYELVVKAKKP